MNCPVCSNTDLRVVERSGVEIDICPRCKGVWLDRGELEKLIDRADQEMRQERQRYKDKDDDDYDYDDDRRPLREGQPSQQHPPKKRESFWNNLFDWD